jgi:RNA polymerase sigma factor (sigma-70 family)
VHCTWGRFPALKRRANIGQPLQGNGRAMLLPSRKTDDASGSAGSFALPGVGLPAALRFALAGEFGSYEPAPSQRVENFGNGCHTKVKPRHYSYKCMTPPSPLIDQVAVFHEDAFSWAVTCCAGNFEAGADTLQECYVKVATGRATFAGRSSLKTWWLSVVRFTAYEQRRGQQRWQRMVEAFRDWVATLGTEPPGPPAADLAAPPEAEQLAAALARLPRRQAEILHLVFQHELSVSDSAAVLGISVGSARQHYERAKKRLRQELAADSRTPLCDHAP